MKQEIRKVKKVICPDCFGKGKYMSEYGYKPCETCNGKGHWYREVRKYKKKPNPINPE